MSGSFFAIYKLSGMLQVEEWIATSQWGVKNDYFRKWWNQQGQQSLWH